MLVKDIKFRSIIFAIFRKCRTFAVRKCGRHIEIWCNGSTTDFGSVCGGSNPPISTKGRKKLSYELARCDSFFFPFASLPPAVCILLGLCPKPRLFQALPGYTKLAAFRSFKNSSKFAPSARRLMPPMVRANPVESISSVAS